jgi:hypothetical protein
MVIESIQCPHCGAPLKVGSAQALGVCAYCNSSFQISWGAEGAPPQLTSSGVKPETIQKVKQLLTDGLRPDAVRFYQSEAGVSLEEAEKAIAHLVEEIEWSAFAKVPLNKRGVIIVPLFLVLGSVGLVWGINRIAVGALLLGLSVAVVSVLMVLIVLANLRNLISTIRMARAESAEATVLKWAPIGMLKAGGAKRQVVRLLLEVRPHSRPSFQVETNDALLETLMPKLQVGVVVQILFNPKDHTKIYLHGPHVFEPLTPKEG